LVFAEAGKQVLAAMEEGLAHPGLAAVVGELAGRLSLVASRRLQLAAEHSGVMAALLRRSRVFNDPELTAPSAAVTRWRIAAVPSGPPVPHAPSVPGLGRALWRLELTHYRGGEPGSWIVEACDATGRLALVTNLAHGSAEETARRSTRGASRYRGA
jgi:protein ImuA